MEQYVGFEQEDSKYLVYNLHKSQYGLKQAPRAWFDKLQDFLIQMGFCFSKADHSLFMRFSKSSTLFILICVDDIIVTGCNKEEIEKIVLFLNKSFSLKDLGDLNYFLGIEVKLVSEGLHLSQKKYIEGLLKNPKMDSANSLPTPMIISLKFTSS